MKKRSIAAIALGGAALFAVPASVAYAVADGAGGAHSTDSGPGWMRAFGGDDPQGRGNATNSTDRSVGEGTHARSLDAMNGPMSGAMHGSSTGNTAGGPNSGGRSATGGSDAAVLVEPGSTLTADETASLVYMVEEEKLSHDLYVELGDAWDMRVFVNISGAEAHHADAVRSLLDAYGVDDPTAGMATGEFANPELQSLYDTLLARGLTSSTAALEVGALVEETDIADLRDRESTNVAIDQVFGQLESGSDNHLRAFTKSLDRLDVTYDAQVLSSSDVANIISQ